MTRQAEVTLRSFGDNTAIARLDWWQPLASGTDDNSMARVDLASRATSLEDWVWQTLDGIAGAAGVKAIEEEEESEPTAMEGSEHLVSMVSSITFSAS